MNNQLETVKTTIQEHPAETIAVASVVTLLGVTLFYRRKNRKLRANSIDAAAALVKDGGFLIYKVNGVEYKFTPVHV